MKILLTIAGIGGVGSTVAVAYSLASNKNAQIEVLFQEIFLKIKKFSEENSTAQNIEQDDNKDGSIFSNLLSFWGSLLNENGKKNNEKFLKSQDEIKKKIKNEQSKVELEEIFEKMEDFSNLLSDDDSMKDFYKGKIIDSFKKTFSDN